MVWSLKRENCKNCGTNEIPHAGHGFCRNCYSRKNEKGYAVHSSSIRGKALGLNKKITRELLTEMYLERKMSLQDISKYFGCNRQNIHYWIKKYEIKGRSKSDSRKIAYKEGKIIQKYESKNFEGTKAIYVRYNTNFFKSWSDNMAYCLGIIYSDGNIYLGQDDGNYNTTSTASRLSISQKDPEILEKFKNLIGSNVKLYKHSERKYENGIVSGEIFSIQINKTEIVRDLMKIGLEPNKSMDMKFPDLPNDFKRHFIRGLWDGDGSIRVTSRTKNNVYWRCDYVCGSKEFIDTLMRTLEDIGMKDIRLYVPPNANAYYLIVELKAIPILFDYLYSGVNEIAYYSKKYNAFSKAVKYIKENKS